MDISTFRRLVDETTPIIAQWPSDLIGKYQFLGLPQVGNYSSDLIDKELYTRIHNAFSPGNIEIVDQCRALVSELIYDEILDKRPTEPYCELLAKIREAAQSQHTVGNGTCDEWRKAIEYAHLSVRQKSLNAAEGLVRTYPNHYAVGLASIRLMSIGYPITRDGSKITLSSEVESHLVAKIENLVRELGGLSVASQIGNSLRGVYDEQQERYHLIAPKPQIRDPQQPLVPWGYLLQLAVKHYQGGKPCGITDKEKFNFLIGLTRDYATILEVQDYSYFPHFQYAPTKMIEALQKKHLKIQFTRFRKYELAMSLEYFSD